MYVSFPLPLSSPLLVFQSFRSWVTRQMLSSSDYAEQSVASGEQLRCANAFKLEGWSLLYLQSICSDVSADLCVRAFGAVLYICRPRALWPESGRWEWVAGAGLSGLVLHSSDWRAGGWNHWGDLGTFSFRSVGKKRYSPFVHSWKKADYELGLA